MSELLVENEEDFAILEQLMASGRKRGYPSMLLREVATGDKPYKLVAWEEILEAMPDKDGNEAKIMQAFTNAKNNSEDLKDKVSFTRLKTTHTLPSGVQLPAGTLLIGKLKPANANNGS